MQKKYIRNIIFSKTPLSGHFRFKDEFQIYPCDFDKAPKSKHASDIPMVIEYWIDEDENPILPEEMKYISFISSTTNQTNKLNRITRLLTAITNHRIHNNNDPNLKWGTPLANDLEEDKEDFNQKSSSLIMGFYYYPDIAKDMNIESFSDQRHPSIEMVPHKHYYKHDPLDSRTKELTLPDSITKTLENYFSLDLPTRKKIDTICHLICNGIDIKPRMKSLSFLSFVSSIETLVNFEYEDQKDAIEFECYDCQTMKASPIVCKKCGRPIWGIKAKFKTFLKTYVAHSEDSVRKFNKIYNLRSEIVHNGMLLLGDEEIDWSESPKADSQYIIHIETMQLSRLALVHWLLMKPSKH